MGMFVGSQELGAGRRTVKQPRAQAIEDEQKIPLRFFVHGDAQCQPQATGPAILWPVCMP